MANLFNKIYQGTLEAYNGVASKDANALYMIKDATTGVKSIYRGETKLAGDFIIVNGAAPETPEQGIIYYISAFVKEEGKAGKPFVGFYDGSNWVALSDSATIDAIDDRLDVLEADAETEGSVDYKVAAAKAAIEGTFAEGETSKTLAAINSDVAAVEGRLDVIEGSGDGSIAKAVQDAVDGIMGQPIAVNDITTFAEVNAILNGIGGINSESKEPETVLDAIADAKAAIEGTLAEGDAATLEEINDELDGHDAILAGLGGTDEPATVVAAIAAAKSAVEGALVEGDITTIKGLSDAVAALETATGGVKIQSVTPTETNVKEEYKLVDGNGDIEGSAHIKIYKDSSLVEVKLTTASASANGSETKPELTQDGEGKYLTFVYQNANGTYDTVSIDVSKFLSESEFGNGLEVSEAGEVSVKSANDYITVGATGIAAQVSTSLSSSTAAGTLADSKAVVDYVDGKFTGATVESDTVDGTNVHVTYKQENGVVTIESVSEDYATVTRTPAAEGTAANLAVADNTKLVKGSDIESVKGYVDDVVAAEETRAKAEIAALAGSASGSDAEENAKVTVTVTTSKGEVSEVAVVTDDIASAAALSALDTYVKGDAVKGEDDSVSGGIEKRVAALEAVNAAADFTSTATATSTEGYATVTIGEAADGTLDDETSSIELTYGTFTNATADAPTTSATNGIAKAEDVAAAINAVAITWETL